MRRLRSTPSSPHCTAQLRFYAYAPKREISRLSGGKITAIRVSGCGERLHLYPRRTGRRGAGLFRVAGRFAVGMPNAAAAPSVTTDKAAARQTGELVMIAPQASAYTWP